MRIDIRSETQLAEGVPARRDEPEVEYAEGQWVANAQTGEMEWHAADGGVVSEAEWNAQAAAAAADMAEEATEEPPLATEEAADATEDVPDATASAAEEGASEEAEPGEPAGEAIDGADA